MRKVLQHFVVLLSLAAVSFSSCNMGGEKVIPRAKLSRIYAEMLMTDQWIQATPGVRLIADTSLVYAPILESYGYTTEDYMRSVLCHCEGQRPVAIRSLSGPRWGTGGASHRRGYGLPRPAGSQ